MMMNKTLDTNHHPSNPLLSAWNDGALSGDEADTIGRHVHTCALCQQTVAMDAQLGLALSRVPLPSLPDNLTQNILQAARAERARVLPVPDAARLALFAVGAAVLAALVLMIPILFMGVGPLLVQVGIFLKTLLLNLRGLLPILKAVFLLAQEVYLPVLAGTALTAATFTLLANRAAHSRPLHLGGA